jgi:hypothetical protein
VSIALEPAQGGKPLEAGLGGDIGKNLDPPGVAPLLEIGAEQGFDQAIGLALLAREADEAMRGNGVRRPTDAVEGEFDALGGAGVAHRVVDPGGADRTAELRDEIRFPADAGGRHVGIELKGAPADRDAEIRALRQGARQAALADEAPGTDQIGDDVDMHDASRSFAS